MIKLFTLIVLPLALFSEDLLQIIEDRNRVDLEKNIERKEKFLENLQKQKKLLKKSRGESWRESVKRKNLIKKYEERENRIISLKKEIDDKNRDIQELLKRAKSGSEEVIQTLNSSFTIIDRDKKTAQKIETLSKKEHFSIEDLQELWYVMQSEIIESGKVKDLRDSYRVGTFSIISKNGEYQQFFPEERASIPYKYQKEPLNDGEWLIIDTDISKGEYFNIISSVKSWQERIEAGGAVGYIILSLGLIAILLIIYRYIYLLGVSRKIRKQTESIEAPNDNNPLGRLVLIYHNRPQQSFEELQARLQGAVIDEVQRLKSGEGLIKLISTVAPLLGLLGTVVGMIITFQSITAYGTNDPKLMADGISQALITTMLGLSVAIPTLFGYLFVKTKSDRLVDLLDEQSAGFIAESIEKSRGDSDGNSI
jgi:biopolymer transport protein ExbB